LTVHLQKGRKDLPMMPLSRGAKAHLPPKIYGLSRYPRSPPSAHMIKEAAVLGT